MSGDERISREEYLATLRAVDDSGNRRRTVRERPEENLQRSVVAWLRVLRFRDRGLLDWWAVPNQRGTRTRAEAGVLKALGVTPGVADLAFILPTGRAAFIELKAPARAGKLSTAQRDFRDRVEELGALWACCSSLDEVEATLRFWGIEL